MSNVSIMCILILFGIVQVLLFLSDTTDNRVKSGEIVLYCFIGDDFKLIEPSKIKGKIDDTWVFVNGSASNCYIKE